MEIFFTAQNFSRSVSKRLIRIALFPSEKKKNLAFRGSEEVLGSSHNGNFLRLFELLEIRDSILKELQNRITHHETKEHYLSATI